jgi:hypothetical protein
VTNDRSDRSADNGTNDGSSYRRPGLVPDHSAHDTAGGRADYRALLLAAERSASGDCHSKNKSEYRAPALSCG